MRNVNSSCVPCPCECIPLTRMCTTVILIGEIQVVNTPPRECVKILIRRSLFGFSALQRERLGREKPMGRPVPRAMPGAGRTAGPSARKMCPLRPEGDAAETAGDPNDERAPNTGFGLRAWSLFRHLAFDIRHQKRWDSLRSAHPTLSRRMNVARGTYLPTRLCQNPYAP